MSKIICEFCGTSYPESAAQCPICGCVRSADDNEVLDMMNEPTQPEEYHHVKGGRFSEKNVRKRNSATSSKPASVEQNDDKKSAPSNKGLVITIIALLVAIAAVIVYIVLMFFGPDFLSKNHKNDTLSTDQATEATVDLSCKQIRLSATEYVIEEIGEQLQLEPNFIPLNTEDQCTYFTDNDAVATVNAAGVVTAIGSGEANITLTCGKATLTCKITVPEPKDPFTLAFTDITLSNIGDTCTLYDGDVNPEEIVWATDDESVAYVLDGNVIAAGPGTTTIYAGYNGKTVTCVVHCDFTEEATEEPTEETQPEPIVDNGPYSLKNAFGFSNSDVTIRIGESFTLVLIDKDGNKEPRATWSVVDGNSCSVTDGVVTGTSSGKSTVVATFNGKEYTCLVRVS